MPGVAICGRCGSNLRLDSIEIDVNPPRASQRSFWRKRFPHGGRYWTRLREFLTQTRITIIGDWDIQEVDPEPVMRRLIVPGWPQIYCGRVRRGQLFLAIYVVCLLLGIVWIGSFWGNQMLGLAVGCHISSVLDIALMGDPDLFNRIRRAIAWGLAIILLIYVPVAMLFTQVISPNVIQANMLPFQAGDILWVNQWYSPSPGDVVLYDITPLQINVFGQMGNAQYLQIQGPRVDRILAGPGQSVVARDGELLIDGNPTIHQPCNTERSIPELNVKVPEGSFLILPSTDPNIPDQYLSQVAIVSPQHITGRVYFRNLPYSRFGFIR